MNVGYNYNFQEKVDKNNIPDNYIIVKISGIPISTQYQFSNFLFAKDKENIQYIVHYSSLVSQNWEDWSSLSIGIDLGILVDLSINHERTTPSLETVILES
jgi:hypothetical protein